MCYSLQISIDLDLLSNEFSASYSQNTKEIFWGENKNYKIPQEDGRVFKNYYLPAILKRNNQREIVPLRFNLLPHFCETKKYGFMDYKTNKFKEMSTYNARVEKLNQAKAYREIFGKHHCIIPVKGFYEWVDRDSKAVEVKFNYPDNQHFLLAGLWDHWGDKTLNGGINSCSIITTPPREEVKAVGHDRSPLILPDESLDTWLDPESIPNEDLFELMRKPKTEKLNHYEIKKD